MYTLELVWKNPGRRPPTPEKVVQAAPTPQEYVYTKLNG